MAVSYRDSDDAAEQVEVPATLVVVQILHVSLVQQQWPLVDVVHSRGNVFRLHLLRLLVRWTLSKD